LLTVIAAPRRGNAQGPAGSYRQSCRDITVQGDTLRATCRDRGGGDRGAALQGFARCISEVFNDDGVLRCSLGANPPPGSYARSCEQVFVDGQGLHARCRAFNGGLVVTTLSNVGQCVGDIFNYNGGLGCSRGALAPAGSYTRSCERSVVDGDDLTSVCRNTSGKMVGTTLRGFRQCTGEIFNDNGSLRCNRGGASPPPGDYARSCSRSYMDAATLHSTCKTISGNEVAASLANPGACRSTIRNIDGRLTCAVGDGSVPSGSYTASCRDVVVTATTITAACRTMTSGYRTSSIDNPAACRGEIDNIDGFLACAKGDSAPPEGSYRATCHDIVTSGPTLSASCRRGDGGYARSSLDFTSCPNISNQQGVLTCPTRTTTTPAPAPPAIQEIRAGATIPDGWIVYDIVDNLLRCGPATKDNVFALVQYSGVPGYASKQVIYRNQ
jgi:hypothetical protein